DLNRDQTDPDYIVTVNLTKNTPMWMQKLGAQAMNLGLDLRGGVHFLLQVDAKATQETRIKAIQAAARSQLRDQNVRHAGIERIVVQLPGVQDVAHAKDIIGRTATLEFRMVDDSVLSGVEPSAVPLNSELFTQGPGAPVVVYKDVVLTGDYISSATASFDQNQ